jgi:hypothetical protein
MSDDHGHDFELLIHLDACHYYSSVYRCACGMTLSTFDERDLNDDPYSALWMEENCERCTELRAGAEPKRARDYQEAK